MLPVASFTCSWKTANDHIWLKGAYHINYIRENGVFVPEGKCLFRIFCIAKIICACKKLLSAIYSACCKQFLGANQSQHFSLLISDQILAAVSAGKER